MAKKRGGGSNEHLWMTTRVMQAKSPEYQAAKAKLKKRGMPIRKIEVVK